MHWVIMCRLRHKSSLNSLVALTTHLQKVEKHRKYGGSKAFRSQRCKCKKMKGDKTRKKRATEGPGGSGRVY